MIRKYLLPVLAVAGLVFAIWMMKQADTFFRFLPSRALFSRSG